MLLFMLCPTVCDRSITTTPQSPKDLVNYPCAAWSKQNLNPVWRFESQSIDINPYIVANDYPMMRYLVSSNKCITELPEYLVNDWQQATPLIEVLPDYPMLLQEINLLYPSRKQLSRIGRTYIDFCIKEGPNCICPHQ